jgi:hypothetical protein
MNDLDELDINEQNDVHFVHFRVNYEHIFDTIIKEYCPYLPKSEDRLRYTEANRNVEYWEDFRIRYLQASKPDLKDAIVNFLVDPLKFRSEEISDVYDLVKEYSALTSKNIARCRILFLVLFMSKELGNELHQILNDQLKIEVPIDLIEHFVKYLKIKYARELVFCINALVDDVKYEKQHRNSEIVMKAVRRAEMRICVMRRDLLC